MSQKKGPQSRSARPCRIVIANDESDPGTSLRLSSHILAYTYAACTRNLFLP